MFSESKAAAEFDTWAVNGRAESMAQGHQHATHALLDALCPSMLDSALDVGCGNGWLVRELLSRGLRSGAGVDISPEMVHRARQHSESIKSSSRFEVSSAERLPFEDNHFDLITAIESIYYYTDPLLALIEWRRVVRPGGQLAIMLDLYSESSGTHCWVDALPIAVHLRSISQWCQLLESAGWSIQRCWRELDVRPLPDRESFEPSEYWPSYEHILDYRAAGSLCIVAGNS